MTAIAAEDLDFSDAWVDGDQAARWRSAAALGPGTGAKSSGTSVLEVDPGCRLERHTDSAEETVVVLKGEAVLEVGGQNERVSPGGVALIPKDIPHEVSNAGEAVLRFAAAYADADAVSTYERPVQPDGERERQSVA